MKILGAVILAIVAMPFMLAWILVVATIMLAGVIIEGKRL